MALLKPIASGRTEAHVSDPKCGVLIATCQSAAGSGFLPLDNTDDHAQRLVPRVPERVVGGLGEVPRTPGCPLTRVLCEWGGVKLLWHSGTCLARLARVRGLNGAGEIDAELGSARE